MKLFSVSKKPALEEYTVVFSYYLRNPFEINYWNLGKT